MPDDAPVGAAVPPTEELALAAESESVQPVQEEPIASEEDVAQRTQELTSDTQNALGAISVQAATLGSMPEAETVSAQQPEPIDVAVETRSDASPEIPVDDPQALALAMNDVARETTTEEITALGQQIENDAVIAELIPPVTENTEFDEESVDGDSANDAITASPQTNEAAAELMSETVAEEEPASQTDAAPADTVPANDSVAAASEPPAVTTVTEESLPVHDDSSTDAAAEAIIDANQSRPTIMPFVRASIMSAATATTASEATDASAVRLEDTNFGDGPISSPIPVAEFEPAEPIRSQVVPPDDGPISSPIPAAEFSLDPPVRPLSFAPVDPSAPSPIPVAENRTEPINGLNAISFGIGGRGRGARPGAVPPPLPQEPLTSFVAARAEPAEPSMIPIEEHRGQARRLGAQSISLGAGAASPVYEQRESIPSDRYDRQPGFIGPVAPTTEHSPTPEASSIPLSATTSIDYSASRAERERVSTEYLQRREQSLAQSASKAVLGRVSERVHIDESTPEGREVTQELTNVDTISRFSELEAMRETARSTEEVVAIERQEQAIFDGIEQRTGRTFSQDERKKIIEAYAEPELLQQTQEIRNIAAIREYGSAEEKIAAVQALENGENEKLVEIVSGIAARTGDPKLAELIQRQQLADAYEKAIAQRTAREISALQPFASTEAITALSPEQRSALAKAAERGADRAFMTAFVTNLDTSDGTLASTIAGERITADDDGTMYVRSSFGMDENTVRSFEGAVVQAATSALGVTESFRTDKSEHIAAIKALTGLDVRDARVDDRRDFDRLEATIRTLFVAAKGDGKSAMRSFGITDESGGVNASIARAWRAQLAMLGMNGDRSGIRLPQDDLARIAEYWRTAGEPHRLITPSELSLLPDMIADARAQSSLQRLAA